MRISAVVRGADQLAARFARAGAGASGAVMVALEESAQIVSAEAVRLVLDGPKSGIVYEKYNPRRSHQASAPGEAPANDLGHLAGSILIDRAELPRARITIAALAKYAPFLEFGTSRLAPRPFLRPALQRSRAAVLRCFRLAMTRQGFR